MLYLFIYLPCFECFFSSQDSQEAIGTDIPNLDEDTLKYQSLRALKLVLTSKGTHPQPFFLPSECLIHSQTDDGAARAQKENYIDHIVKKQCKYPNAMSQDPMEGTLVFEISKPWTHSITAFTAKLRETPDFNDFKIRIWAHQHLFESRKRVATYFVGNKLLSMSFSIHLLHIWVDLSYEEESELSSIHNLLAHDINSESVTDKLYKLRLSWTRMGSFDWANKSSQETIDLKLRVFRCVGIKTKGDMNNHSWMLRLACTPQTFFDKLVAVAEAHREFKLKGMKAPTSDSKGKKNKPKETSLSSKFSGGGGEEGPEIKNLYYKELSWLKLDKDFIAVTVMLESVRAGITALDDFMASLADYKDYKFLRIQLRVKVIFILICFNEYIYDYNDLPVFLM